MKKGVIWGRNLTYVTSLHKDLLPSNCLAIPYPSTWGFFSNKSYFLPDFFPPDIVKYIFKNYDTVYKVVLVFTFLAMCTIVSWTYQMFSKWISGLLSRAACGVCEQSSCSERKQMACRQGAGGQMTRLLLQDTKYTSY